MSLYADYVRERLGKSCLETEHGFVVYSYQIRDGVDVVYIEDIYVEPKHRKTGLAAYMADEIAKEALAEGVYVMMGSVLPEAKGSTDSMKVLIAYGMEIENVHNGLIFLSKKLEA